MQTVKLNEEQIAACAYYAWENEGRPHGRDMEFWLEAEAQLIADLTTAAPSPKKSKPAKAKRTAAKAKAVRTKSTKKKVTAAQKSGQATKVKRSRSLKRAA